MSSLQTLTWLQEHQCGMAEGLLCCTQRKLQTLLQKVGRPIPEYTCQHSGPDHMPSFQATVRNGQCQLPAPLAPVTMLDTMNETAAMQCATWILC